MVSIPPEFYTTAEQEAELDAIYMKAIQEKQKELDTEYGKTKRVQKFTAYGYIHKEKRVFFVCEKGVFWKDESGPEMPKEKQEGGKIYKLHTELDSTGMIHTFAQKFNAFTVTFDVTGRYGPCVGYCAKDDVYPAVLECEQHKLIVEDENSYDCQVC
jgi:hypothetical protein